MREVVFAIPGDLATPTGGYVYDRRMIQELAALGWQTRVIDLGDGFPQPSADTRITAGARLAGVMARHPVVVDGLAFGALPEAAQALRASLQMVALVHHPLALESGLSMGEAAALRASEIKALACARHVIATSATTARLLAADYDIPAGRLTVIEPGTDPVREIRRKNDAEPALLAVGAVVPRKGYDVLIAALGKVADLPWHLIVAGDCGRSPETFRQLEGEIGRLGLAGRITFRGGLAAEQLARLYASSDLFVLASRFEGYGMAYAEAVANGLPVLGTTAGAIPETVPAGAAVLVPPDDVERLAGALRLLIESREERERLAVGARLAEFPRWRQQATRFARVLESVS